MSGTNSIRTSRAVMHRALALAVAASTSAAAAHADPLTITFPAGLPALIAPEQGHEVVVHIVEGTQGIEPGTPAVHYRIDSSSPFSTLPLQHISGPEWSTILPGFPCGEPVEVYFSAEGDGGAVVRLPHNAPAMVFSADVADLIPEALLATTFEAAWPDGWWATGFWHVTHACAPVGNLVAGCEQGPWAYMGRAVTCNYSMPVGTPPVLGAPPIELPPLPPGGRIAVTFCYALETSQHEIFDRAELYVNNITRSQWRLPDVRPTAAEPDRYWTSAEIDLTEFAGETVSLSWRMTAIITPTEYRGWHLNNVQVLAYMPGCAEVCYANCDGSTTEPVLTVDDFTCFINAFAQASALPHEQQINHYANCDGSTEAPILTVDDFTCFVNAFAAGCP